MSRIDGFNRFVQNPVSLDRPRSKHDLSWGHKTTFKSGDLVPIYLEEVLPGDTIKINVNSLVRMLTPAVPVMDNCFLDLYFFFEPFRLCTKTPEDFPKIMGENFEGYWANKTEFTLDNTGNNSNLQGLTIDSQSVLSYLGLPITKKAVSSSRKVCNMPARAYCHIWNEWFRDQNTQAPVDFDNQSMWMKFAVKGSCLKVNKFHDYFTSALQAPQKGDSVLLPLAGLAPVLTAPDDNTILGREPLHFLSDEQGDPIPVNSTRTAILTNTSGQTTMRGSDDEAKLPSTRAVIPSNLVAQLQYAESISVNAVRQSFAIQRILEKDARGGTRYIEMLKSFFGVSIPEAVVQRPEYLGGKRIPINIAQVLQTSETTSESPLGATGAFSNTFGSTGSFVKSFNEFGYIMGFAMVRTSQSYSQGIRPLWTRNRRYDFYNPVLDNIGEQPIFKRELYIDPDNVSKGDEVFGYKEAWAEYRYHPNQVSGNFAPNAGDLTLTAWTYTNNFSAYPVLNSDFNVQPSEQVGDTLVITDTDTQFIADFFFDVTAVREMSMYSIPGLIDHH